MSDDPNKELLIDYYQNRCVICHTTGNVTIHEIFPKSLNPKNWMNPENRIALCAVCHDNAHRLGTKRSRNDLLECMKSHQELHGTFDDWLIGTSV